MSISIEDLKSQLFAAVDAVPAGMAEPLEALYSRDNKQHRLSPEKLPVSATRRVPTASKALDRGIRGRASGLSRRSTCGEHRSYERATHECA